ncbi:hypothetical protein O9X81_00140 [Agrobacterium salinitolerans]|uniref:hypothetical protein n=1 Tax=Agrobacterium salinitolerans TaxID=1183413 RepID=UPI0022B84FDF|nr:hypothetical protein [Agrobacterium salinitolerans]MCZ7855017.1 hypothetical protein [Agrobacterium salinitolerans]
MTELTDLIGKRSLDAVDFDNEQVKELYGDGYEDCSVCRFRLDGVVYIAIEDPGDGYRSSMRSLAVANDATMKNVFPAIDVVGWHRTEGAFGNSDDVLELIDTITGKVVLEVGTDDVDDYYPGFVARFHPENMATNADIEADEKKAAEGWIEWNGGECPVSGETLVVIQAEFSPEQEPSRADQWAWDSDRPKRDQITAYRVVGAAA